MGAGAEVEVRADAGVAGVMGAGAEAEVRAETVLGHESGTEVKAGGVALVTELVVGGRSPASCPSVSELLQAGTWPEVGLTAGIGMETEIEDGVGVGRRAG